MFVDAAVASPALVGGTCPWCRTAVELPADATAWTCSKCSVWFAARDAVGSPSSSAVVVVPRRWFEIARSWIPELEVSVVDLVLTAGVVFVLAAFAS